MTMLKTLMPVWVMESQYDKQRFAEALASKDPGRMIGATVFAASDMTTMGWTRVGVATVELEIENENQIRQNMVGALREQKKTVLAKAQLEATQIEEQIQNLLAISYEAKP